MLLKPYVDILVILEGGIWPPSFLRCLLVGALSSLFCCLRMLLLPSVDTLVILEGGVWQASFLILVGTLSCLWMLLMPSVNTLVILEAILSCHLWLLQQELQGVCLLWPCLVYWMLLKSSVDTLVVLVGDLWLFF